MKATKCKSCSMENPSSAKVCSNCGAKIIKPIYKRWWFRAIMIWLLIGLITAIASCSFLVNYLSNADPADLTIPPIISPDVETTTQPTASPTLDQSSEPTEQPTEAVKNQRDGFIGMPLSDFMAKVDELGYKATYMNQGEDWTDFIESFVEDYLVGGLTENPQAKTVVVDLLLKSDAEHDVAEQVLRDKLETGSAWIAAKNHGEAMYGESFELHYLLGKIEEYAEDENTWFLKAECTVLGNDMVCEAKVTGTSDHPEVIYFEVY